MRLRWKRVVIWVLILALLAFMALQLPVPSDNGRPASVWDPLDDSDRILEQIRYIPRGYESKNAEKIIYVFGGLKNLFPGNTEFYRRDCSVKNCMLTDMESYRQHADAVITKKLARSELRKMSKSEQIWILYVLESPYSVPNFRGAKGLMNWTASYRRDSTIVTPYAMWVPFDPPVKSPSLSKNFAAGKTKKVAWFVSNCRANNNRLEYAKELAKYISVDIMGACGNLICPRSKRACWELLNTSYKFYLSFENSNCRDYITEKFFENGLRHDVIPIVMGAHPDDYRKVAPPHSFISVDDYENPKSLAEYLHKLDNNDDLYNRYFHWKGTGEFIDTKFICRVCALLNDDNKPTRIVDNLEEWWNGTGICQKQPWRSKRHT